jgi:uncharacterized membrane protein
MTTTLTPLIAVHMSAALSAVALGPFALWARLRTKQHPKLHRAFGYAWVTMMLVTATTAIFIQSGLPSSWVYAGYSPIHLLILVTYFSLFGAFWFLAKGNIAAHRSTMLNLYVWACVVTGGFTFMPGRFMHEWLLK